MAILPDCCSDSQILVLLESRHGQKVAVTGSPLLLRRSVRFLKISGLGGEQIFSWPWAVTGAD